MNWLQALCVLERDRIAHVLVTIVSIQGSAPREIGTKMVVTATDCYGTIGGGNLEYQATKTARELIVSVREPILQLEYGLGEDLTQCCGGRVKLLFENLQVLKPIVALFGGGHVGTAVVKILGELDYQVNWYESRDDYPVQCGYPENINLLPLDRVPLTIEQCSPGVYYLVMTHSHEIDFELVEAILSRGDARFCGLIASRSKAARFRSRLRRKEFSSTEISGLSAPVGLELDQDKQPMAVAVAIVSQLLQKTAATASDLENTDLATAELERSAL